MTEKRGQTSGTIPECEHGYWGGFSPERKDKYQSKDLAKQYSNGRARLYPQAGSRRIHSRLKKSGGGSSPRQLGEIKIDSVDPPIVSQSPISVFKINTTNDKVNEEVAKMRIEKNQGDRA